MAYRINFPGGASGTFQAYFSTTNYFAQQVNVGFPTNANQNLAGDYTVRVSSINPSGVSGSYSTRITYPEPSNANAADEFTSDNPNYGTGSIITSSSQFGSQCGVRIYKNGASTVYFNRTSTSGGTVAKLYKSTREWDYSWGSEMCGYWEWNTVPGRPASITATKAGLKVTVTYTAATDDGGDPIDSYTIQRAVVTGGTNGGTNGTVGTWTAHSNSDTLSPSVTYRFRVYATNNAGNGLARESVNILISAYAKRNTDSGYVNVERYERFTGSTWTPITTFKRFNGSTWEDMTPKT